MQEIQKMQVWSQGQEEPLEEEMVTPSSILAQETPGTEDPGVLQSMRLQRVGPDWSQHYGTEQVNKNPTHLKVRRSLKGQYDAKWCGN